MTIKINGTNTTAQPSITGTDTDTGLVYGTDEVSIVTGGTDRVKVDGSGKVGIGCTPVRDLQLHTADASSELMLSNSTTGATAGSGFMIQQDGNDNYIWNKENSFMSFGTNATERLRILPTGGLTFNGDTAAANALDDYEEGTWTPVGNITLAGAITSRYIKIGRFVTVTSRITFPSSSSGTTVNISGLPFSVDDDLSNSAMANAVGETSYTVTDRPVACVENSDLIRFRIAGSTSMTYSNLSGHNIRFSVSYFSST